MQDLKPVLAALADRRDLTLEETRDAFRILMSGEATQAQVGGFLLGMRAKGETPQEISGAVAVLREKMVPVKAPDGAIDVVGTGGDGAGTYNISTASAFVCAGAGLPVAKHGNRALSSKSGAADVLAALGIATELSPAQIARCIEVAGLGFMFAPSHHPAMRYVAPARIELGTRTIFNLLGPLANPASVKRIMLGVFSPAWVRPVAEALRETGTHAALVVNGAFESGRIDEISTVGETVAARLDRGEIEEFTIEPEAFGLPRVEAGALLGGGGMENAAALRNVLDGEPGPYRDVVLMNAGAGLLVGGAVETLKDGVALAAKTIDSGSARAVLDRLVIVSNEAAGSSGHG